MSIRTFAKSALPSPVVKCIKRVKKASVNLLPSSLAEYARRKKRLAAFESYIYHSDMNAFVVLDDQEEYERTGKIFDGEQYYSQAYQDYFMDRFIFRKKEGGFFLDIGGNDPVHISNTYFFEKNRGWTGLAFEPIPEQRGKWKTARTTECLPYALGSKDGESEFCQYEDQAMSGFSRVVEYEGRVKARWKVPVRRLSGILEERGIKHVDFVSLDVEGAEIEVLKGIDFSRVKIDCFTIENNKGFLIHKEQRVRRFMLNAGYKLKARLWLDEVWIRDKK